MSVSPSFQELITRVPEGEAMVKALSSRLASNASDFGYSESVTKSLKLELHAVQERISSLKAGLRTWQDHLARILSLDGERKEETEAAESTLDSVAAETEECERAEVTDRKMLEKCKVSESLS